MTTDIRSSLLNQIQADWPPTVTPFATFAERVGATETAVLETVRALEAEGIIRQIGPIFDTKSLGYASSLVAMRIAPEALDSAAAIINAHPGVSHNYRREHEFNLWFTLAVPPDSALGLERTVRILHNLAGAESTRLLPTLRLFKIGVQFQVGADGPADSRDGQAYSGAQQRADLPPLTEQDKALVRVSQQPWPVEARPADPIAAEAGIAPETLIAWLGTMRAQGRMRRFAAVLRHRKAGFTANGMGVWVVPPDRIEDVGTRMAGHRAVTHCYQRPTYDDWPYSIFTMVHGQSHEEVDAILAGLADECGITEYGVLYSTTEYKKVRLRYFTPEVPAWERTHTTGG